ncbi:MAG TPA: winged helix-turn-helix domain-containing protein [Pyrinomonadaceae bacterium]|nr:winged helix-turn-helix domain-containing protein [Pyrinomonadaceae bacterium]
MIDQTPSRYRFGKFEFDPDRLALYCDGEMIKVEKKALEVLAILVRSPRQLVATQEIIDHVWADNPHGVTGTHLAQSISKLRKALAGIEPDSNYIETVKGSGYVFQADIEELPFVREPAVLHIAAGMPASSPVAGSTSGSGSHWPSFLVLAVAGIAILALSGWLLYPTDDETEIRRVLEASQKYESLVIYRDPANVNEEKLKEYWLSPDEFGLEVDLRNIRTGIARLQRDSSHYGPETRNLQFEIQEIQVDPDGGFATAKTLEKWFVAEYRNDGTLVKNKTVGPYFVHYILRKHQDKWKIERSSTARATKPAPVLESLAPATQPVAGSEFRVTIAAQGVDPESVFIRMVGPGCPDVSPCIVPNSALRLSASLSDKLIDAAPLTLTSGEYSIAIQNGESVPSNSLTLTVP